MHTPESLSNLEFTQQFIRDKFMAVVACVSLGYPRTFTVWYALSNGEIYWKSRIGSEHSQAFEQNPEASLCIYDHAVNYPDDKVGVQVLGTVRRVTDPKEIQAVIAAFADRFGEKVYEKNSVEELVASDTNAAFYALDPNNYKLVSKHMNVHMEEYKPLSL